MRFRKQHILNGAVRKVCRCEPVTDVTGVAAPRLDGNSLVLRPRCLKIRGIATPACALVRNDRAFSNSPKAFLISSAVSSVAEEDDQPQQLGQGRGRGGDVGQGGGPEGFPCAILLVLG